MFLDILGAQKYSGQSLPKIPYGTKAVKNLPRHYDMVELMTPEQKREAGIAYQR